MFKKTLALLLALVLALGLVACGGSKQPLDGGAAGDSGDANTGINAVVGAQIGEPWTGDYATATWHDVLEHGIGSSDWDGSLPISTTNEKVTFGLGSASHITDFDTNAFTLWLEEKTGVNIEVEIFAGSASDIVTQLSLMLQGGEKTPDVVTTSGSNTDKNAALVDGGFIVNTAGYFMTDSYYLSQAVKLTAGNDPETYVNILNMMWNYCGSMQTGYMAGTCTTDGIQANDNIFAVVNEPWLEKLGLEKPDTVEELYDVLVAFRDKDPNGNGVKDEVPMVGIASAMLQTNFHTYLLSPFIPYNPNRKAYVEDGVCKQVYIQDEYRQGLIYINKLVKEGLLSELSYTMTTTEMNSMLNPDVSKGEPYVVGVACIIGTSLKTIDSLNTYGVLPVLKDATGHGGYSHVDPMSIRNRMAITASCQNVKLTWRLLDFMYSPEAMLRARYGVQGRDWDWIENTQYKDKAAGNGALGGDAKFVILVKDMPENTTWSSFYNTWKDDVNWQCYVDPEANTVDELQQRLMAENFALHVDNQPPENMVCFPRTPEEDEAFWLYNNEINTFYKSQQSMFGMGFLDPNSDTDWNNHVKEFVEKMHIHETWGATTQGSYDRQQAQIKAYKEAIGYVEPTA